MATVKCKICGEKIEKETAFCITKINDNGRKTNSYFCSEQEYEKNKRNKELWLENMRVFDAIIGYTCINKVKTNEFKMLEEHYSREQIYNCLIKNADEIKMYLEQKNIIEEYGRIKYIFSCIRNKIKDDSNNIVLDTSFNVVSDYEEETNEELEERIKKMKKKKEENNYNLFDIIKSLNKRE